MPDDAPLVEHIIFSATTEVVDDQWPAARVCFIGNNADVIEAIRKLPRDNIASAPLRTSTWSRQCAERLPMAGKVDNLIHHTTMVNILIEFGMLAMARVSAREASFVLVNETLFPSSK